MNEDELVLETAKKINNSLDQWAEGRIQHSYNNGLLQLNPQQIENLSEITNQLKVLASETFSSVSSPIQYAAIAAHKNDHTNYINHSKNILKTVGNYVYKSLKSNNVLINKPQGGFYLLPEFINKKFSTSTELCDNILKETGVALLPGSDFGFSEKKMLARLSYTDFDGENFMNNTVHNEEINYEKIKKHAPKIIEGINRLKDWSNN